jgi:hypothetical protein
MNPRSWATRNSASGSRTPHSTQTNRAKRSSRIVHPVSWVSLTDTCTIDRGIAADLADSHSVALPRLPLTK